MHGRSRFLRANASLVALAVCWCAPSLWAEVRGVDLKAELESAQLVVPIEVLDYAKDGLRYRRDDGSVERPDELLTARYWGSEGSGWVPTVGAQLVWDQQTLTGEWPPKGSHVLLVVNSDQVISLFAAQHGAEYRFWSPWMTGSVAGFVCQPPARALPGQADNFLGPDRGWDGCLLPVADLAAMRGNPEPGQPLKPASAALEPPGQERPRFGFRMDLQTFRDLRSLAPELPGARWPGLTEDGQRAWESGAITAVYNTGYFLEEDLDGDGQADAALLLDAPGSGGAAQRYLLLASRRISGVPWTRTSLTALPQAEAEWDVMAAVAHARGADGMPRAAAVPAPTRTMAEWVARLAETDPRARLEAADALGTFGPEAAPAAGPLAQLLYDPEELVRNAAVSSLQRIGPAAVPELRALVAKEGSTLGRHDPGARSQRLAVSVLGALTPATEDAVRLAADVCRDRSIHDLVRHDACLSLARLGANETPVSQEAIRILLGVIQESDADASLRTEVIYALEQIGPDASIVEALAQGLRDPNVFVRRAAAATLGRLGAPARAAAPELRAALSDADPEVKALAQGAVGRLENE